MKLNFSPREKILFKKLQKKKLSPTHDFDHLLTVVGYALKLAKKYGGRRDILVVAGLLHDLGRSNPKLHGTASIVESCRQAREILKEARYEDKEITLICQIIKEHDQPKLSPKLLEAKILKDADFLDGFGARGIWRTIFYTAEAGQTLEQAIKRLKVKMPQRLENLEFRESQQLAQNQFFLAPLFLNCLEGKSSKLTTFAGKYIVFEGTSGTGKETQAKLLCERLKRNDLESEIIYHPSPRLKETLKNWRKEKIDSFTEALLFISDRYDMTNRFLSPALKKGRIVISLRNKISTLIYQAKNDWEISLLEFLYSFFEPLPDIIFFFDLKPEEALKRVYKRYEETGEPVEKFEKLDLLRQKREKYQKILKKFKNVVPINASKSIQEIHQEIWKILEERRLI